MKKSGMGKRLLPFILTAALVLHMKGIPAFAETLRPESEPGTSAAEQPELLEDQPETPEEEQPESESEMWEEDWPESESETEEEDRPESESETWEEDQPETLTQDQTGVAARDNAVLPADILKKCTVSGLNPEQATVNLFDYWQKDGPDPVNEVPHDYYITNADGTKTAVTTFDSGISDGHMLRFAYRDNNCDYCIGKDDNGDSLGNYGAWNQYLQSYNGEPVSTADIGTLYPGIVKNKLGADGFPELNLSGKNQADYGWYYDAVNQKYLAPAEESLAYLFSPNVSNQYKNAYRNVQGLFQLSTDGYYYYDSTQNFASYDGAGSFVLYNSPGVARASSTDSAKAEFCGQFFPFNSAEDVFDSYTADAYGKYHLTYLGSQSGGQDDYKPVTDNNGSYKRCYAPDLNHYLGMTLEVPFLQPVRGLLPNGNPMTFEFSGDDDVWVFIDDVLVADLGGLHDAYSLKIDFNTGNVYIQKVGRSDVLDHTLLKSFQDAYGGGSNPGGVAFHGAAFADNTVHTLKMFYLERGHMASNLSLKFNIQTARYHQIRKVDQEGKALENAEFALYPAQICTADAQGSILCTVSTDTTTGNPYYVKQSGATPLITFRTGTDGIADFISKSGDNFGTSGVQYYILRETRPPDGYRSPPVDIVLEYNSDTTMFTVANRWQTGAYASFTSYVNGRAGTAITYGEYTYSADTGFDIQSNANSVPVPQDSQKNGLILAVPMLQSQQDKSVWLPLYGSNTDGFHTVGVAGTDRDSMGKALLEAALCQCRYDEGWYLEWNDTKAGLEGSLTGLPGRADRYQLVNSTGDGDMRMVYIIIEPTALEKANITGNTSAGKYQALKRYVAAKGTAAAVSGLYGSAGGAQPKDRNVNMLDTAQFMRVFRSLIYIPNELRELRVLKTDEDGTPLEGAQFGIFGSREEAQRGINAIATETTGEDGTLIFNLQANAAGQTCYLKEIRAPQGYGVNDTVIPVVIGIYSVYADAGTEGDGVSVRAGVGRLYRTMVKYASDGDVNITLRDITAIAQTQDSGSFALDGWEDLVESSGGIQEKALHYGINREMWMDYGLHDADLETEVTSFFETQTGFLRTRVVQNAEALQDESGSDSWENLGDIDLTSVFGLINIVVVKDRNAQDREDKDDDSGTPFAENGDTDTDWEAGKDPEGEKPAEVTMAPGSIDSPQTGDDSLIGWWAVLCIISLTGICATVCNLTFVRRKEKKRPVKKRRKSH